MAGSPGLEPAEVAVLFDRHRLRVARELRGLSQVELAREVGTVRAASVSQFEQGHSKPSAITLQRLAVALRVPLTFFAATGRMDHVGTTDGFFRSLRSAPPRARQRALAHVEIARDIVHQLESFVRLPELDLPRAQSGVSKDSPRSAIEGIAAATRAHWGIPSGPINDVVLQLERHGIITTRFRVDHEKIDAFSVPFADRPIIVLGADKNLRDRSRFDAAHELGHLVLHREDQAGDKAIEGQAHQFAAAFLMPAEDIKAELPSQPDWARLLQLKARWHVSIAALLKRALTLEVMDDGTYLQALKAMSTRGWRRVEPGDLGLPEQPSLLRRAVDVAAGIGIELSHIAERSGLPLEEVHTVVGAQHDARPPVEL